MRRRAMGRAMTTKVMREANHFPVLADGNIGEAVLRIAVHKAAVVVLALAVKIARRRWLESESAPGPEWTLQGLREMLARGELTDAEYERLRATMIADVKAASAEDVTGREKAEES